MKRSKIKSLFKNRIEAFIIDFQSGENESAIDQYAEFLVTDLEKNSLLPLPCKEITSIFSNWGTELNRFERELQWEPEYGNIESNKVETNNNKP